MDRTTPSSGTGRVVRPNNEGNDSAVDSFHVSLGVGTSATNRLCKCVFPLDYGGSHTSVVSLHVSGAVQGSPVESQSLVTSQNSVPLQ